MTARSGAVHLVVVSAGLSEPSATRLLADRLADATSAALGRDGARVDVEVVELRTWARDLTNQLLTGFPSEGLRAVQSRLRSADAAIMVTPIFNASYSGLFKTFFDVLEPESLSDLPVLIGATGGSARHSLALEHAVRPLFSYLHATVVPTAVYAAPEDWASPGDLAARVDRAAGELASLVQQRSGRESRVGPDGSAEQIDGEVIPFTRLLAGRH